MGDRGNIKLLFGEEFSPLYLYTHWSGSEWPETLRQALDSPNARARWADDAYLARIIVSSVFADCHGSETGAGI